LQEWQNLASSTETIFDISPFSEIAEATDGSSSPELPIHVVQPNPTILKPCSFRYFCSPLTKKYKTSSIHFSRIEQTEQGSTFIIQIKKLIFHYEKYL